MSAEPETAAPLPTRQSLLSQLRDCQDQAGWREFFDTYWRLIYNVVRQSGLGDAEAQDVVQNTFIYLTRRMPAFHYDRQRGSFKSWLRVVTRSRIRVYLRKEKGADRLMREPWGDQENPIEEIPDPAGDALDHIWQREWEVNLVNVALRRLRSKISARHLLIFRLAALGDSPLSHVAKRLGVSLPQVYLIRHRVGRLFKAEVKRLRSETE